MCIFIFAARCSNLDFSLCGNVLSYNRTYFPNPTATDNINAITLIEDAVDILECHDDFLFLLCGMLFPDCPHAGPSKRPCRSLCEEVEEACVSEYQAATEKDWPITCSLLSDSDDGDVNFCTGGEGGKVTIRLKCQCHADIDKDLLG